MRDAIARAHIADDFNSDFLTTKEPLAITSASGSLCGDPCDAWVEQKFPFALKNIAYFKRVGREIASRPDEFV